jgi:hypothetical protein
MKDFVRLNKNEMKMVMGGIYYHGDGTCSVTMNCGESGSVSCSG